MHIITELWDILHCVLYYLVSGIVHWCVCEEWRVEGESNCCCLKTYRDGLYYTVV